MFMWLMSVALTACAATVDGSKPLVFDRRDNQIVVPVSVSGSRPFRFLLDTGASRSLLSARVALEAGARANLRTVMITPAGRSVQPAAAVTLQLGEHAPFAVTATVVPDEELGGTAMVDGIVGQDVLNALVYTIDYKTKTIVWHASANPECAERRVPLEIAGGRAIVTISVEGVGEPLRLIPDTGADSLVLFARRDRQLPALTPMNVGMLRTLAGHRLVRRVLLDGLTVGGVDLRGQSAVVLAESDATLPAGDGLLPLHLFSRVTINGPAGYITVTR